MQAKGIDQEMNTYFMQWSLDAEQVNLEDYNKDIDEAMKEIARGESYPHEEVVKMSKKW